MYKGIFWCYVLCFDDDMFIHNLETVRVQCDMNGNPLEPIEFSSKSGDNFNHEIEWEKIMADVRPGRRKPFDYYPRGRVEVKNGVIKVFANPVIVADEDAKDAVVHFFELKDVVDKIKWIADGSKHYEYCVDAMDAACRDDEEV